MPKQGENFTAISLTVSICGDDPRDAYTLLCEMLADADFHTKYYTHFKDGKPVQHGPTDELFPDPEPPAEGVLGVEQAQRVFQPEN